MRFSVKEAGMALVLLGITAGWIAAHDFWIVPVSLQLQENQPLEVHGQTSTRFPASESAVAPPRVAEAVLVSAQGRDAITDFGISEKSLVIRHTGVPKGQYVVGVRLVPSGARSSAEAFKRYLEMEGASDLADRYAREGRLPTDSITRRSIKYAKTFLEVGRRGPRAFEQRLQHPLEIVLLRDPGHLHAGDTILVAVELFGKRLPNATIHGGYASLTDRTILNGGAGPQGDVHIQTDANGIARLGLGHAGLWNLRTIHALPSDTAGVWDVHWATVVFAAGESH